MIKAADLFHRGGPAPNMSKIELRMGANSTKAVEELEAYITCDRVNGTLNLKLTDEGIIVDQVHPISGKVLKTMCMMYDEFVEEVMT